MICSSNPITTLRLEQGGYSNTVEKSLGKPSPEASQNASRSRGSNQIYAIVGSFMTDCQTFGLKKWSWTPQ